MLCSFIVFIVGIQDTLLHMVAITEDPEVVKMVIEAYVTRNTFKDCLTLKNKFFRTPLQAAIVHGHTDSAILLFDQCLKTCPEIISKGEDDGKLWVFLVACYT